MWMIKGRILMQKHKEKGKASHYKSITCLPFVCKLLTGVIAVEVYGFLIQIFYYLKNKKRMQEKI